jgi:hypothetical protein
VHARVATYRVLAALLLIAALGPADAATRPADAKYVKTLVGTLCPALRERLLEAGADEVFASKGKQSFVSAEMVYCQLISKRKLADILGRTAMAPGELENRTIAVANRFLGERCKAVGGELVFANTGQVGCGVGDLYRFAYKLDYNPSISSVIAHIKEPVAPERANAPGYQRYLADLGLQPIPAMRELAAREQEEAMIEAARREARLLVDQREAERRRELDRQMRPRKVLVGTRLCHAENGFEYYGFTEAYSAQTGKIQIRVAGTTDGFTPSGFQPGIIWDHPDRWAYCDSN